MQPATKMSEDEYLAFERGADRKHELVNGQILAMAGGSPRHNAICANLIRALGNVLRGGPCRPLTSDQRVHVPATGLFTYPDVTVVCGEARYHAKDRHTLLTPTVLFEVLSPTTEADDRGAKFHHYASIESLREYVLVGSVERRVEHYRRLEARRHGDGPEASRWELTTYDAEGSLVELPALAIAVPFDEVYEGTDAFPL